ncbi:ATP-binding protein [uncultured Alsobacter sp.]|uniref:ATP-binding protein n=1 Tax=uncultured Alsobacter sp. TaxID=1748258 RepID=UPI0025E6397F|nr:ATP-binding protein [uncultured Alsobacter sp.]
MKPSLFRFASTATFRLTLVYAATFVLSTLALFAYVYWRVSNHVLEHERSSLAGEVRLLTDIDRRGGADALVREIAARMAADPNGDTLYLLRDGGGASLAGNIAAVRRVTGRFEDEVDVFASANEPRHTEKAVFVGAVLPGDRHLAVGRDIEDLSSINSGILERFLGALAFAVLLAFAGGTVISMGFLRKLETINQTAETIMEGKLSERIPLTGTRDELDQLAANLNRMLDRIQGLMETTRQVSSDIAHDLRTPLSRLRQRLEQARDAGPGASPDTLDVAVEEIDGILSTFSALLRIAQIETGARVAGFKQVDLSAVFATIAEVYTAVAEDAGLALVSAIDRDVTITGDRELLTQMLANLVENAIRYSPAGSSITLRLQARGGAPVGMVADTGPGIPAEEREKVFGRFYRLERNRTTPGNGLGLSLVNAVADLHGSTVSLEDNRPGLLVRIVF